MRRPPDLAEMRAAVWAYRSVRWLRARPGWEERRVPALPAPPRLPAHAVRGVRAALRRADATCLEHALVRQGWFAAHGELHDVVIGVAGPAAAFRAHAWLDDDPASERVGYTELTRLPPHGAAT